MNKVILMGRLTKEPELRQTQNGTTVTSFTLAVLRRFAKECQQEADFINCTAWQKTAEFICKYFQKGQMIAVSGRLQSQSWEKDGKKQYSTSVIVDEVDFVGGKKESGQAATGMLNDMGFSEIDDGDVPF